MRRALLSCSFLLASFLFNSAAHAQNQSSLADAPNSSFTADYPTNRAGIFLLDSSWKPIANENPSKTKIAHGIAANLTYGLAPAKVVAEYQGEHASTQADAGQLTICICHLLSIPGEPAIVKLQPKKGDRELDGGKLIIYPVIGGSKIADANKSNLIPTLLAHPDPQIWLIRTQSPLAPGEYALMLGTSNLSIFPFTVSIPPQGSIGANRQAETAPAIAK